VIGDGLNLALACDLRIASEAATFQLPEVAYGFIPGWGLIHRLVVLIGRAKTTELLLTCQQLEAQRAYGMGLINEIVPSEQLINHTLERAREISSFSPAALRAVKCALRGGDERSCFRTVWGGTDWKEGIVALLEKRAPLFGSNKKQDELGHLPVDDDPDIFQDPEEEIPRACSNCQLDKTSWWIPQVKFWSEFEGKKGRVK